MLFFFVFSLFLFTPENCCTYVRGGVSRFDTMEYAVHNPYIIPYAIMYAYDSCIVLTCWRSEG